MWAQAGPNFIVFARGFSGRPMYLPGGTKADEQEVRTPNRIQEVGRRTSGPRLAFVVCPGGPFVPPRHLRGEGGRFPLCNRHPFRRPGAGHTCSGAGTSCRTGRAERPRVHASRFAGIHFGSGPGFSPVTPKTGARRPASGNPGDPGRGGALGRDPLPPGPAPSPTPCPAPRAPRFGGQVGGRHPAAV